MRIDPLTKMGLGGQVDLAGLTQVVKQINQKVGELNKRLDDCMKFNCDDCDCKMEDVDGKNATDRKKTSRRTRKDVSSS